MNSTYCIQINTQCDEDPWKNLMNYTLTTSSTEDYCTIIDIVNRNLVWNTWLKPYKTYKTNDIIHCHRSAPLACAVLNDNQGILHLGDLGSHSKALPEHYWEDVGRLPWQTPPVLHIARGCSMILCYPREVMKYITETSRKNTVKLCQVAQMISVPSLVRRRMFASSLSWGGPWGGPKAWADVRIEALHINQLLDVFYDPIRWLVLKSLISLGVKPKGPLTGKSQGRGTCIHHVFLNFPNYPSLPLKASQSIPVASYVMRYHFQTLKSTWMPCFGPFAVQSPVTTAVSHHQDTAGEVRRPWDGEILRESGPIFVYDW